MTGLMIMGTRTKEGCYDIGRFTIEMKVYFQIQVRSSAQNEINCKFMYSKDYYTYTPNTKSATSTKNGHPVIT